MLPSLLFNSASNKSGLRYLIHKILEITLIFLLIFIGHAAMSTTYTTTGSGTWDANGAPPSPLLNGDVVNVNHNGVFFDWPNTVTIQSGAVFNINSGGHIQLLHLVVDSGGSMNLNDGGVLQSVGSITNNSDNVVIDGQLTDNDTFVNNGAITGTGIISVGNPPGTGSGTINGTDMNDIDWSQDVDMSQPLPVILLEFSIKNLNGSVEIIWTTGSETNNDYFSIERSPDLINWNVIAEIAGAGTSTSINSYVFYDQTVSKGNWYYRLKQTDYDGGFEYFKAINVTIPTTSIGLGITCYPTYIHLQPTDHTPWQICNLKGHVLKEGWTNPVASFSVPLSGMASGMYLFKIKHERLKFVIR